MSKEKQNEEVKQVFLDREESLAAYAALVTIIGDFQSVGRVTTDTERRGVIAALTAAIKLGNALGLDKE